MVTYRINVEKKDGWYIATSPNIKGLIVTDKTRKGLMNSVKDAIDSIKGTDEYMIVKEKEARKSEDKC